MKKFLSLCVVILLCAATTYGGEQMKNTRIRKSVIAGSWYPADPGELRKVITDYLAQAEKVVTAPHLYSIFVPHAGYAYSGACAAWSFKQLEGRDIERVFLLAPSHSVRYQGISIPDVDAYETPLGLVPLDTTTCNKLRQDTLISTVPEAHTREHSLEIQLPFLQVVCKDFKVVPLVVSAIDTADAHELGLVLSRHLGSKDILVASGDFTHYGDAFGYVPFKDKIQESIKKLDMGLIDEIQKKDVKGIFAYERTTGITCCGIRAFAIAVAAMPKDAQSTLLKYTTSGEKEGDFSHSVSYAALAFSDETGSSRVARGQEVEAKPVENKEVEVKRAEGATVTAEEKQILLKLARDTVTQFVTKGTKPDLSEYNLTPRLKEKAGAFVTLHENGQLRGCIGFIEGVAPLAETVLENACNAAMRDPRFPPVTEKELDKIDIEISVMTPLKEIDSPDKVIAGKHGVVLKSGLRQGVFLPQVATEQGWDRKTFLEHLGLKAGLSKDAYKNAVLLTFTAEVFGENGE
jgi:MEMO1 family protein